MPVVGVRVLAIRTLLHTRHHPPPASPLEVFPDPVLLGLSSTQAPLPRLCSGYAMASREHA